VTLQVKGNVWKPIEITPAYAVLNVPPDTTNATTTVRIVNNTEQAMTLSQPEVNNPAFSVQLKTNTPGKEYQLVVALIGTQ
jgi:hypothetical protein